MFIYSAKVDKRKIATILICIAVVVLVLIFIFSGGRNEQTPPTADEIRQEQLKLLKKSKLETNDDRLYLLTALGWEVEIQPAEFSEVSIPEEFSKVYENYNKIQKDQGFDLYKYRGDKVMRYTYIVVNHPSGDPEVTATLLVYKSKLIGGDVCTTRLDGFMHTLLMPLNESEETGGIQTDLPEAEAETSAMPTLGVQTQCYQDVDYNNVDIYPTD